MSKKLNNFVEEVLVAELRDGDYAFETPRAGWVHLGFNRAYYGVTGRLDGSSVPVVTYRNPPCGETMRWLTAGKHVLAVKGAEPGKVKGGKVSIRLVKPIIVDARGLTALRGDAATKSLGLDFYRANVFAVANTLVRQPSRADDPIAAILEADLVRRGLQVVEDSARPPEAPGRLAYRLNGTWQVATEPPAQVLPKLATDSQYAALEAVAFGPTVDEANFKEAMALLKQYCVRGKQQ